MRKYLIIIALMLAPVKVFAPGDRSFVVFGAEPVNPFLTYWYAVKLVELQGKPDTTINRDEWAYGPGQIRAAKLDDFNQATGKNYSLPDCLREPVAREVFMWHCLQYREIVVAVKRWNGSGPMAEEYWGKIEKVISNR